MNITERKKHSGKQRKIEEHRGKLRNTEQRGGKQRAIEEKNAMTIFSNSRWENIKSSFPHDKSSRI